MGPGLRTIRGCGDSETMLGEHLCNEFARRRVIFDDKDQPSWFCLWVASDVTRNRAKQSQFVDGFHQIFVGSQERSHTGLIDDGNHD